MKKLITFLIRRRMKLKRYEMFQFVGQKKSAVYYFTNDRLMKSQRNVTTPANVSLNWLLNDECEIKKLGDLSKWL